MKIVRSLLVIAMLLAMMGLASGVANAGAFTYTSGFQVQNLEGSTASINIDFYRQNGTLEKKVVDTISANGSKTYFPLSQVSDGFNGSVVISSDKQVAAVSNIHGDNFLANASYVAATTGNTSVRLPLLMKGNSGYNTWFNVQNTGGSDANVTVNYSDGTSNSATVKPGAAHTFDQALESHSLKVFAATITSNQPVAATVIEENTKTMFAYSGANAGSNNPVMPLINANNSGYTTGVQIQNVGTSTTNVTVSYTPSTAGSACTETQSINAGESKTFALSAFSNGANSNCIPGQKFVGSARVSTNSTSQPLVVIVNQHVLGKNGEAYGGFDPNAATSKVVMPLIMDRNSGYWTGFNVMNVGTTSTTVTCTFTGTSYQVGPTTLSAGQALTALQNGNIASGYVGSGTCTATGGGKIVAVVNELGPSGTADQFLVYEGVTAP